MKRVRDIRRKIRDRFETRLAVLGDETGAVDAAGTLDKCWVRFVEGVDANGNQVLSAPVLVNVGVGVNYISAWGAAVRVGRNEYGEWEVMRNDPNWLRERNISPRVLNQTRPDTQFVSLSQLTLFRTFPVGTASQPSNRVTLYPLLYEVNGEAEFWRGTELEQDKPDLTPFFPSSVEHRLACVFYNLFDKKINVYASPSKSVNTPIDFSDVQACFAQALNDDIPSGSYVLRGGQFVDSRAMAFDLRQFINTPSLVGDVDEVVRPTRLWPNRVWQRAQLRVSSRLLVAGRLIVGGSAASVSGGGGGNLRVRDQSNSVNVQPVTEIVVPTGNLINLGAGAVEITGSGAPNNASYVLGAPNSSLPNSIPIPSLRASADRIQITSGIYDHFEDPATASNYTWVNPFSTFTQDINTTIPSHMYLASPVASSPNPNDPRWLRDWSPTGNFDARCKVQIARNVAWSSSGAYSLGMILENTSGTTRMLVILFSTQSQITVNCNTFSGSSYSLPLAQAAINANVIYLRISRTGGTTTFWFSDTGNLWVMLASTTLAITVARMGVRFSSSTGTFESAVDWLWTDV